MNAKKNWCHRTRGTRYALALSIAVLLGVAACSSQRPFVPTWQSPAGTNICQLSDAEKAVATGIFARLKPDIDKRRRQGTHVTLSFQELYAGLDQKESAFLTALRNTKPGTVGVKTPYLGCDSSGARLVRLEESFTNAMGVKVDIPPQYLPEPVWQQYEAMMEAMQRDLGRRLYVTSGYRSGAYQLYLFLGYLPKHGWSVQETARFVALPGYSEHGDVSRQALDFVNSDNIADQPGQFEKLPEFKWLGEHAGRFGFALSYPPNSPTGISFEPWHWHAKDRSSER